MEVETRELSRVHITTVPARVGGVLHQKSNEKVKNVRSRALINGGKKKYTNADN